MNINTIDEAFEFLRMDGSQSQALIDCMNAYAISKAELEGLFYKWCWSTEDGPMYVSEELAYSIELGRIEDFLTCKGLIYQVD